MLVNIGRLSIDMAAFEVMNGGSENSLIAAAYRRNNRDYILRLTHWSHRSFDMIGGEAEWVRFLADRVFRVSKPIPADRDWKERLFSQMGKYMGAMHASTKLFHPATAATKRQLLH